MADLLLKHGRIDERLLGKVVTCEEYRQVELEMLNLLAEACDAHGLTYYLSGGTLLGAVRHKGFIPWDDDIDVNMPRPDVERLLELTGGRLNDHTVIATPCGSFPTSSTFPRVFDTRYIVKINSHDPDLNYYSNLFIDIFPIEGLPTNMNRVKLHFLRAQFLVTMRRMAFYPVLRGENRLLMLGKRIMRPLARLMGADFWNLRLQKLAQKYRYEDCAYVGVVTACAHKLEEYIRREGYGTPSKVEFEGRQYNAPADWNTYLTNLYGDYMKLPPVEKRQAHDFTVYRIKDVNS